MNLFASGVKKRRRILFAVGDIVSLDSLADSRQRIGVVTDVCSLPKSDRFTVTILETGAREIHASITKRGQRTMVRYLKSCLGDFPDIPGFTPYHHTKTLPGTQRTPTTTAYVQYVALGGLGKHLAEIEAFCAKTQGASIRVGALARKTFAQHLTGLP